MFTILVVDDKEVFRRKIKRMPYFQQNREKFEIRYEAQNGLEAMDVLRKNCVDVVLTDIRMPFIDGIELLKRVNAESRCRCVILLSEFAEFSYAKAGIINGAFDYVLKPIDNKKIQETFDRTYHYLTTIRKTNETGTQKFDSLVEFMLKDDRVNALAYANYIETGIQRRAATAEDRIVLVNEALEQLRDFLLQKRPYLQYYIPFSELCHVNAEDIGAEGCISVFAKQILAIMEETGRFAVRSKNKLVQKACGTILTDVEEKVSLQDIADRLYVCPKYLGSLMKKEIGKSFVEYLTFVKMERAKILLRNEGLKIYEVASALGYSDVEYFSKVFKRETSESPSSYREMGAP